MISSSFRTSHSVTLFLASSTLTSRIVGVPKLKISIFAPISIIFFKTSLGA